MKALILAGGFGTRLRPLTDHVPKSLLPICNVPFLEHQVRLLAAHGISDVTLLTGYLPDEFGPFAERVRGALGVELMVSTEREPLGTAGAVRSVRERLDDTTVVLNGDVLTDLDIGTVLAFHAERSAAVTIVLTSVEDARPYGLVATDDDARVLEFREKPADPVAGTINAGTYVLEPSILDDVPADTFWQFEQNVFPALLSRGAAVYGYLSPAYWLDIGTPERYLRAHADVLEGRARAMVDGQIVRDPKEFGDGTALIGPVLLSHAPVGPGARIGPLVCIGSGARIGARARIERSVVSSEAEIGEDAVVIGSIVGRGARVPAGTVLEGAVVA